VVDHGEEQEEESRWWGATLLEHDGRTIDSVAIRTLDYDPYPDGGFPDRSLDDVIFIGPDTLVNHPSHDQELSFRIVDAEATISLRHDEVADVVNDAIMQALRKNARGWGSLTAAQQAVVAEQVATKKQKLIDLLQSQDKAVVTASDMQEILAQTMQD